MSLSVETDFGLGMMRYAPANESLVVSPISVIFALAMIHPGVGGRCRKQIDDVIFKGVPDGEKETVYSNLYKDIQQHSDNGSSCEIANGFFLGDNYHAKKDYADNIAGKYSATIRSLNFSHAKQAAEEINAFIENATHGNIRHMLSAKAVKDAHFLLVNAIHFTAEWLSKFNTKSSVEMTFYSSENNKRQVTFMRAARVSRLYADDDDVQVLSLPYKDTSYSFNIFLPKTRFGLDALREKLTGERLQGLLANLHEARVSVAIPKMKIETDFALKEALKSMGIEDIFTDTANFSGMIEGDPATHVSNALHKAVIEVDESGTSAAAATSVRAGYKSLIKAVSFVADHPFMFILTKNRNPIFMGQYV
ncbi:hypothetical protein Q1695_004104 [Nippostrongylus brasiliensis]|nr:hypothetical protein Q1695_004104 [Nippostrongylus brasiliensis]